MHKTTKFTALCFVAAFVGSMVCGRDLASAQRVYWQGETVIQEQRYIVQRPVWETVECEVQKGGKPCFRSCRRTYFQSV